MVTQKEEKEGWGLSLWYLGLNEIMCEKYFVNYTILYMCMHILLSTYMYVLLLHMYICYYICIHYYYHCLSFPRHETFKGKLLKLRRALEKRIVTKTKFSDKSEEKKWRKEYMQK